MYYIKILSLLVRQDWFGRSGWSEGANRRQGCVGGSRSEGAPWSERRAGLSGPKGRSRPKGLARTVRPARPARADRRVGLVWRFRLQGRCRLTGAQGLQGLRRCSR